MNNLTTEIMEMKNFQMEIGKQNPVFNNEENKNMIVFLNEAEDNAIEWIDSLKRLVAIAQGDTGQSRIISTFLIAIYNAKYVKLNLRDLNNLDQSLWFDCINVLKLDHINMREIHRYIANGNDIFSDIINGCGYD